MPDERERLLTIDDERCLMFWAAAACLTIAIASILYQLSVAGRLS